MAVEEVGVLGQNSFLMLLTTQLRFQDPLNPMDNTEFVTQLAQFAQLQETTAMRGSMDEGVNFLASLNNYSAAGLVGREVTVVGGSVQLIQGTPLDLLYELGTNAEEVTAQIFDAAGNLVGRLEAGEQSSGIQSLTWNGIDEDGNPLPSGEYTYSVSALNATGDPVGVFTYMMGVVTGVRYDNGTAYLIVNGEEIPASGVVEINQ